MPSTREEVTVTVTVTVDGKRIAVVQQSTVAAALTLAQGIGGTRLSTSGTPRAPFCGMGVCEECRVTVDGRAHALACQTVCRDGMLVETERAAR